MGDDTAFGFNKLNFLRDAVNVFCVNNSYDEHMTYNQWATSMLPSKYL